MFLKRVLAGFSLKSPKTSHIWTKGTLYKLDCPSRHMEIVEINRANFLDNDIFIGSFRKLDICLLEVLIF